MSDVLYRGPRNSRSAFSNRDTHPLVLDILLIKRFGTGFLEWDPDTVWFEISTSWRTTISEANRAKIQALRTCHLTHAAYTRWEVFEKVCQSLSGRIPDFSMMEPCTPQTCAGAISIMEKIQEREISDEVRRYIAACCMNEGVVYSPPPLGEVNEFLAQGKHASLQKSVAAALNDGVSPSFDGSDNTLDVQVAKSQSILDYVKYLNKQFLTQLKQIRQGGD